MENETPVFDPSQPVPDIEKFLSEPTPESHKSSPTQPASSEPAPTKAETPVEVPAKKASLKDILNGKQPVDDVQPASAEPAKAVEEEEADMPKGMSQKGQEGWKALKAENRRLKDEGESRTRQYADVMAAFDKRGLKLTEVERFLEEHQTMSERLMALDLKSHPAYQRDFNQPREAAVAEMKEALRANDIEESFADKILAADGKQLRELVDKTASNMSDLDKSIFVNAVRKVMDLRKAEGEAERKAGSLVAALRQRTEQTQRETFEREFSRLSGGQDMLQPLEVLADAKPEQRQQIEAYNASVKMLRANAERLALGPASVEQVASASIKAAAFDHVIQHALPRIEQEYSDLMTRYAQLAQENQRLRAARPNAGNSPSVTDDSTSDSIYDPSRDTLSSEQRLNRLISEMSHG